MELYLITEKSGLSPLLSSSRPGLASDRYSPLPLLSRKLHTARLHRLHHLLSLRAGMCSDAGFPQTVPAGIPTICAPRLCLRRCQDGVDTAVAVISLAYKYKQRKTWLLLPLIHFFR